MSSTADGGNVDLNLMVALQALLEEKNVTRAAHRLHLSQPTLSVALAKLRAHFDDPLLLRVGSRYELTPLAQRLALEVGETLDAAHRLFDRDQRWDPSGATREFTVVGADYGFAVIGSTVLELAKEVAPGARLRFTAGGSPHTDDPAGVLRSADVLIRPHGSILDLPFENVWRDRWVVLASADNLAFGDVMTLEDVAAHAWVLTHHSRSAFTSAGLQLRELGMALSVDAVVDSFFALPNFVVGTKRLAIVPQRLLASIPTGALRTAELPIENMPIEFAIWWHPTRNLDPEHAWLRSLFRTAGRIVSARWR